MSQTAENWYVYYPAPSAASALPLLRAMQEQLAQRGGISARVEERVETGATPTWMEVYEGVKDPDGFAELLRATLQSTGYAEYARGRHIERFRPLQLPCA